MKKRLLIGLSCVFLLLIATACGTKETKEETRLKIAALKGPTAMGMVKLIEEDNYDINIVGSPDEILPKLIKKEIDMAAVPANLASILYNNTNGEIQTLAINTLGVLYIVENGDSIKNIDDLEGKTIYSSGKGATPEYILNYILEENSLKDKVKIEYKSEHLECLTAIINDENGIAMLPEPFVTIAIEKNSNIKIALNLNNEWKNISNGDEIVTGVLVGRKEVIEKYEEKIKKFLDDYEKSILFTNLNINEASLLIEKNNIVPKEIAIKAIEKSNIAYIDGKEMKEKLERYLKVLNDKNPKAVGGKIPNEDFYFIK